MEVTTASDVLVAQLPLTGVSLSESTFTDITAEVEAPPDVEDAEDSGVNNSEEGTSGSVGLGDETARVASPSAEGGEEDRFFFFFGGLFLFSPVGRSLREALC